MEGQWMSSERPFMVLVNGLAEQEQTWFANVPCWRQHFEVLQPNLNVRADQCDGALRQDPCSIAQRVEMLREYIGWKIGRPAHLAANSMGGKVAVKLAVRHPEMVNRLVLLAPSGLTRRERLPILAGAHVTDPDALVRSVFHDPARAPEHLFQHYRLRLKDRAWRRNLLETIRATSGHGVRGLVGRVRQETLVILGSDDRVVDPLETAGVARRLPRGRIRLLGKCGHAPQIERADVVNRLVVQFLVAQANRPIVYV
jgi:pimeloyl-ACP methyl ester carboxylesterase